MCSTLNKAKMGHELHAICNQALEVYNVHLRKMWHWDKWGNLNIMSIKMFIFAVEYFECDSCTMVR
jgi:hypothetical protein